MKKIGRKIWHLGGGIFLIGLYAGSLRYFGAAVGRPVGLSVLAALFVGATAADYARLKLPGMNRFFFQHFSNFIRDSERAKLTGTPWYILGVLCATALYPLPVAVYAVAFLACGDVAATTVGERWGSVKLPGSDKSVQGSAAFLLAALIAGLAIRTFLFPAGMLAIFAGALTAAIVEVLPVKINDNLTIPVVSGAVIQALL